MPSDAVRVPAGGWQDGPVSSPKRRAVPEPPPSLWRSEVSWVTWALIAVSVPITVIAMLEAARDPHGDTVWGVLMYIPPGVVTAYAVIELLWAPGRQLAGAMFRMLAIPGAAAVVSTVTIAITYALPPVQEVLAETRDPDGWHYWLGAEEGNPWLLSFLAGYGLGVLVGLVAWVFVVLPVTAFRRPREFAETNMMSTRREDFERNRRAGIAISFLLILIFAIPSLIVGGAATADADDMVELFTNAGWVLQNPVENLGEIAWFIGLLLIPVAIWLVWYIYVTQRVDRAARAASGMPMGLRPPRDRD
jgi:hypothetical protein